jgi:hypothetical protein
VAGEAELEEEDFERRRKGGKDRRRKDGRKGKAQGQARSY